MTTNKVIYKNKMLKREIIYACGTLGNFAKQMGLSYQTIYNKLNNKVEWSRTEITKACGILNIDDPNKLQQLFFDYDT